MHLIDLEYKIGANPLFANLNVHFHGMTGIVGCNGSGKSSLLRILSGLCAPSKGKVIIGKQNLYDNHLRLKTKIGYVPASSYLYPHLTIAENIYLASKIKGLERKDLTHFNLILRECHLEGYEKILFSKCSDGIKKRALIASALISRPSILILDEPCAMLDPFLRSQLLYLLKKLAKEGTQILFSSHHPEEISSFCDEIYHLHQKNLKLINPPPLTSSIPSITFAESA